MGLRTVGPRKWYASKYFSTLHRSFPYRSFSRAVLCDPFIHSTNTELQSIPVKTDRPVKLIDSLRKIRHNINYYGYIPSIAEAEDAISITKACYYQLLESIKKEIR